MTLKLLGGFLALSFFYPFWHEIDNDVAIEHL